MLSDNETFVGLTLMAAQAFFYNAIFFTYALIPDRLLWHQVRIGGLVPVALCVWEILPGRSCLAPVRYHRT